MNMSQRKNKKVNPKVNFQQRKNNNNHHLNRWRKKKEKNLKRLSPNAKINNLVIQDPLQLVAIQILSRKRKNNVNQKINRTNFNFMRDVIMWWFIKIKETIL